MVLFFLKVIERNGLEKMTVRINSWNCTLYMFNL